MQIIDWEAKGNVVRFYLGKNGEQWGDDWNDAPYEFNAGRVYAEYVGGYADVAFPFDVDLVFPEDGFNNSKYTKEMMRAREIPFIVVVPESMMHDVEWDEKNNYEDPSYYDYWKKREFKGVIAYYFGDELERGQE